MHDPAEIKKPPQRNLAVNLVALGVPLVIFLSLVAGPTVATVAAWLVWLVGGLTALVAGVGAIAGLVVLVDMFLARHAALRREQAEHRAQAALSPQKADHEIRLMQTALQKAQREAEVMTVVAGGQVYISDANSAGRWKHMHQMPHWESNGRTRPPSSQELDTFRILRGPRAVAAPAARPSGPPEPSPALFPQAVRLLDVLPPAGPSLNRIIFGLTISPQGERQLLRASLHSLVHVAVGGASGWGKSVFLLAFMFQVAAAPEDVEIVLIDPQGTTFPALAGSDKLRYQPAETAREIAGILNDLEREFEERARLFKQVPGADKLSVYNRRAADPLPPVVVGIDEMSTVMAMLKSVNRADAFRSLTLRCRKYGIYFLAGSPTWKAKYLDSGVREQYSSTVHFHARDKASSRVLLGQSLAATLDKPGHAYAALPGRELTRVVAPYINYEQALTRLGAGQPPPPPTVPDERAAQDAEFARLVRVEGKSRREAALQAYGKPYAGQTMVNRGKAALGEI